MKHKDVKTGIQVAVVLSPRASVTGYVAVRDLKEQSDYGEFLWRIVNDANQLVGYFTSDRLSETRIPGHHSEWDHAQMSFVAEQAIDLLMAHQKLEKAYPRRPAFCHKVQDFLRSISATNE